MGLFSKYFVDVKRGTKVTYSESDLRKLDRTYEKEVTPQKHRKVLSPLRKVPQQAYLTQTRDYAYEKILDYSLYTFKHLLVIPNPYDVAKQTALILFNSSKETKIRYRVLGDTPDADFVGETGYTKRHRVPVMGLYLERSNKVELEMIDRENVVIKRRMIRIYVSETPKKVQDTVSEVDNKSLSHFPYTLINGVAFYPMVIDGNGAIRYSLQLRTNSIGMIPLENGHFLYEDRTANRMNKKGQIKPCRYHEIDYMGRVYRTFLLDFPIIGTVAQKDTSMFMVTSSDEKHIADQIIEIDMNSGKIIKKCNMVDLLGDKYYTKENWVTISNLSCAEDKILVTMKRVHTVMKLDWKKMQIEWLLSPKEIWKGSKLEEKLLHGDIAAEEICRRPDSAVAVEIDSQNQTQKVLLFQEKSQADVSLNVEDSEQSGLSFIEIDEKTSSYKMICSHECIKNLRYGTGIYSKDKKRILMCAGVLKNKENGTKAQLLEIDSTTGEIFHKVNFMKTFSNVWTFEPNIEEIAKPLEISADVIFGSINDPEEFTGQLPEISDKKIDSSIFSGARLCDEIFLSNILPSHIDRIYFVGENHAYVQNYENMKSDKVKFPFAVALRNFKKDEYKIYVEYNNEVHCLKDEIRVIE